MAGSTGLEPAASGVTGRRSNQLNYDPDLWILMSGSELEGAGRWLVAEVRSLKREAVNGRYRIRTCDSRRVKPVLYH